MVSRSHAFVRSLSLTGAMCLAVAGCNAALTTLPDGRFRVDCPGGYHDWSKCERTARNTCGENNVDVDTRLSNESGDVGTKDWSTQGTVVSRSMIFSCVSD